MNKDLRSNYFHLFILGWLILNLVANYFIEVNGEEAYYWLFSENLAWGYLDHPPGVGVFTALGYSLFPNPLGMRLGMLLLSIVVMYLLRATSDLKNDKLLIWIFLGFLPLHMASYMVKTDVPLIAFLCLFFLGYKRYLKDDNWKNVLIIAIAIAGVMMSKYHGFLMVIFTVLSNLKLLKRRSFWAIVVATTLLMIPHLLWQIENEFATFKFHLYNRIDMDFSWDDIAYYIFVQPIVFGPLIGVILLYALIKSRPNNDFNRALIFSAWGVFIFFLYTTFKVEFHKHWTSVVAIPLILLGFEYINKSEKLTRTTIRLSQVTLVLLVLAKTYLIYDFLPKSLTKDWDVLHGWQSWADEVKELSGGLPVMFNDHYERASRYQYLSQDQTHCYNTFDYRETQHDLLSFEEDLQGETVFQINRTRDTANYADFFTTIDKGIHYRVLENFRSYRNVWIESVNEPQIENGALRANITMENKYSRDINFSNAGDREVWLNAHLLKGLKEIKRYKIRQLMGGMSEGLVMQENVTLALEGIEGDYDLRFSIQVGEIEPPINGPKYPIEITQ